MTAHTEARITGLHTIGVPVRDQDEALEFYNDTLGFPTVMDVPLDQLGGRWIVVAPQGSATTLALVPATDKTPAGVETGIRFASNDATALHAALTAQGVRVGDLLNWPGVPPMFTVHDPDGNGFSVTDVPETTNGTDR